MSFSITIGGITFTNANLDGNAYADETNGFVGMILACLQEVASSWSGTSTTSLTVGTGNKSLTVQAGRHWVAGAPVRICRTSDVTVYMDGVVSSYNSTSGALVVAVSAAAGSGTFTDWSVGPGNMTSVSPGATPLPVSLGGTGSTTGASACAAIGALTAASGLQSANNLTDLASVSAARTALGLGSIATQAASAFLAATNNLSDLVDASAARSHLGLGTAATLAVGVGSGNIPQLGAGGKLPAVDGSLLTGLPASPIPSGTAMLFYQASAPTGWTKQTGASYNDRVFVATDGTGANPAGGTTGGIPGTWDNSWGITVQSHTLTAAEMPSHSHSISATVQGIVVQNVGPNSAAATGAGSAWSLVNASGIIASTGGDGGHSHALSSSAQWRPPSSYCIVCTKN